MKKVMLAVSVLALCSFSFAGAANTTKVNPEQEAAAGKAQTHAAGAAVKALATSTCSYTFTSGSANTFLQYCVTVNGNITQLATPVAREFIQAGSFGEGYGVCDTTASVAYYDYADFGDSGNWGPPTLLSHTATVVKIQRSTSDGIWTLTQTITQQAGTNPSVKVAMVLKNNTAVPRGAFLMRYADVDASGTFLNSFDGTATSAFGWNSEGGTNPPYGLSLQNSGNPAGMAFIPFIQNVANGPAPCSPGTGFIFGPISATDGSIVMFYEGTVPKSSTRTVSMTYKGL